MQKDILCAFSGGGFRATFFHCGVLRGLIRLGLKDKIKVISSVSGGSLTNALFGLNFDRITTTNDLDSLVITPLIKFCKDSPRDKILLYRLSRLTNSIIDGIGKVSGPIGLPLRMFSSRQNTEVFIQSLDEHLFHGKNLSDLSKNIRIVINSTNLNNGARWRFDNNDFGDYKTGYSREIDYILISQAVMASACYPGLFSPLKLQVKGLKFFLRNKEKMDLVAPTSIPDIISLSDGGIFDNLGHYSIKSELDRGRDGFLIISDAANHFSNTNMEYGFLNSIFRISDILMEQISNRDRQKIMDKLLSGDWEGCLFKLENSCRWYRQQKGDGCKDVDEVPELGWSDSTVSRIAQIRTDLNRFTSIEIDTLIHHGESVVETVIAKWHNNMYKELIMHPNYRQLDKPEEFKKVVFDGLRNSNRHI